MFGRHGKRQRDYIKEREKVVWKRLCKEETDLFSLFLVKNLCYRLLSRQPVSNAVEKGANAVGAIMK
jgi:hypothetical protein